MQLSSFPSSSRAHSRARGLATASVVAAMSFTGLFWGLPTASADAVTNVSPPTIQFLDPVTLQPAVNADDNTPVTQPKVGVVLMVDPGTWSSMDGTTFTYQWQFSNNGTTWSNSTTSTTAGNVPRHTQNGDSGNGYPSAAIGQARNFAPTLDYIGMYLRVTVTAHNGSDAVAADPVQASGIVLGLNPWFDKAVTNSNYPSNSANKPAPTGATPYTTSAWLTLYGFPDNTPPGTGLSTDWSNVTAGFPNATQVARGIHSAANGTGTYAQPITMATDSTFVLTYGTEIYVPRYQKYFIAEDTCYECQADMQGLPPVGDDGLIQPGWDGGPGLIHFDLWAGGGGATDVWQDVVICENQLTLMNDDGTPYMDPIIVSPPADLPVNADPIWDQSTGLCNGEPLDKTLGSSVGQYRNVAPAGTASSTAQWNNTAAGYTNFATNAAAVTLPTDLIPFANGATLASGTDLCMTDPGNSVTPGQRVTMEPCADPNDPTQADLLASQMFSYTGAFLMINDLCVDMGNGKGYVAPGTWTSPGFSNEDIDGALYNDAYSPGRNTSTAIANSGSAPRPITLQRCNYNANQVWEGSTNYMDMQTGYWELADLGPNPSGTDAGAHYLWAVNINSLPQGHYSSDYWSTPTSRGANDTAQVNVDVTAVPLNTATDVTVTGGGLTTLRADVYLFSQELVSDDNEDGLLPLGTVDANTDGTFSLTFTMPDDLASGDYQVVVYGVADQEAPTATDGLSAGITVVGNPSSATSQAAYAASTQRIGNFPFIDDARTIPTNLSVAIMGTSAAIRVMDSLAIDVEFPTVHVGDEQTVTGMNFIPGEEVALTVYSDPLDGGTAIANADGTVTFTFTVPVDFALGEHTATLTGTISGAISGTFQVIAEEVEPPVVEPPAVEPPSVEPPAETPAGGSVTGWLGWAPVGVVLLAGGLMLAIGLAKPRRRVTA